MLCLLKKKNYGSFFWILVQKFVELPGSWPTGTLGNGAKDRISIFCYLSWLCHLWAVIKRVHSVSPHLFSTESVLWEQKFYEEVAWLVSCQVNRRWQFSPQWVTSHLMAWCSQLVHLGCPTFLTAHHGHLSPAPPAPFQAGLWLLTIFSWTSWKMPDLLFWFHVGCAWAFGCISF